MYRCNPQTRIDLTTGIYNDFEDIKARAMVKVESRIRYLERRGSEEELEQAIHEREQLQNCGLPLPKNIDLLGSSTKVKKGEKQGVLTAVLYMSPSTESGINNCPMATPECSATCLGHSSGQLRMEGAKNARLWKTALYYGDKARFKELIDLDINRLVNKAEKEDLLPAVRFDGSTDLGYGAILARSHPEVVLYDYTKVYKRMLKFLDGEYPDNYYLTFSYSGDNMKQCLDILDREGNVAVVFNRIPGNWLNGTPADPLPKTWYGYEVKDADETDIRFWDPDGIVAGLRFKHKNPGSPAWHAAKESAGSFVYGKPYRPPTMLPTRRRNPYSAHTPAKHFGQLHVDDAFHEIINVTWDSGLTPRHILAGLAIDGEYDLEAVRWWIDKLSHLASIPKDLAVEVDEDLDIVDGFHRLTAAKILDIEHFPFFYWD
jgi:hypothetical protein